MDPADIPSAIRGEPWSPNPNPKGLDASTMQLVDLRIQQRWQKSQALVSKARESSSAGAGTRTATISATTSVIKLPIPNGGAVEKDSWQYYLHALAPLPVNAGSRIKALIMDAIKVRHSTPY